MPKYKRIIVLISIVGVMATSMISVITSCSSADADARIEQTNKAKTVKSKDIKNITMEDVRKEELRMESEYTRKEQEVMVVNMLCTICNAQIEFKKQHIKDQNKNGIGEYASNTELINFIKAEKEKKSEFSKRILPELYLSLGEEGNLFIMGFNEYCYRVFIPEEPEMQEQYWLGMANRKFKSRPNYFYYNKIDMIFYTDENLSKLFKDMRMPDEICKDPWALRRIFFGKPIKSPINTALWKVLSDNHLLTTF